VKRREAPTGDHSGVIVAHGAARRATRGGGFLTSLFETGPGTTGGFSMCIRHLQWLRGGSRFYNLMEVKGSQHTCASLA
jgi:hypothetical protein